jgi:hypothetical protein
MDNENCLFIDLDKFRRFIGYGLKKEKKLKMIGMRLRPSLQPIE